MRITTSGKEYESKGSNLVVQCEIGTGTLEVLAKLEGMPYALLHTFTADGLKRLEIPECTVQVNLTGNSAYAIVGTLVELP